MLEHIWEFVIYVEPDGSYTEDKILPKGTITALTFSNIQMDFGLSLARFLKNS